jgi:hypothetical protein
MTIQTNSNHTESRSRLDVALPNAEQIQDREMTIMATPAGSRVENSLFVDRDRIVRRLDEFPDLNRALRTGDVPTARILCARLFNLDGRQGLASAARSKAS